MENTKNVVAISETEPVIRRVDLIGGGRDGLKVTYGSLEVRSSVISSLDTTRKQLRPVQKELRNYFAQLKEHLLRLNGYHWANENVLAILMEGVEVNYITVDDKNGKFIIGGIKKIKEKYKIVLNTANMQYEDYEHSDEVREIFKKIINETKLFIKGVKGADSKQVVVDYMVSKREMPEDLAKDEFENMSAEEQKALMEEAFGNYGLTVSEENGEKVIVLDEGMTSDEIQESYLTEKTSTGTVNTGVSDDLTGKSSTQTDFEEEDEDDKLLADILATKPVIETKTKKK